MCGCFTPAVFRLNVEDPVLVPDVVVVAEQRRRVFRPSALRRQTCAHAQAITDGTQSPINRAKGTLSRAAPSQLGARHARRRGVAPGSAAARSSRGRSTASSPPVDAELGAPGRRRRRPSAVTRPRASRADADDRPARVPRRRGAPRRRGWQSPDSRGRCARPRRLSGCGPRRAALGRARRRARRPRRRARSENVRAREARGRAAGASPPPRGRCAGAGPRGRASELREPRTRSRRGPSPRSGEAPRRRTTSPARLNHCVTMSSIERELADGGDGRRRQDGAPVGLVVEAHVAAHDGDAEARCTPRPCPSIARAN